MKKFIKKITHTAKSAVTCVKTAAVNSMSAVLAFNRRAVCSNAGEGYIDTAVKVLIAVVLGALVLAGLYAISIIWTAKNRPSPLPSRALPPAFPASWKAAISSRSSWRTIRARVKQPFLRSCSMWRSSR